MNDERLRVWLEAIESGQYSASAMATMAQRALAGEVYAPPQPKVRVCSICGLTEEEPDYEILSDVRVIILEGEEGYSDVTMLLCETNNHLAFIQTKLMDIGFVDHNHGGTALLQDKSCPGARYDPQTHRLLPCPTPTDPYEDRYMVGNYHLYKKQNDG